MTSLVMSKSSRGDSLVCTFPPLLIFSIHTSSPHDSIHSLLHSSPLSRSLLSPSSPPSTPLPLPLLFSFPLPLHSLLSLFFSLPFLITNVDSLKKWKEEGKRGIWLKVPPSKASVIDFAVKVSTQTSYTYL